jgi:hypothetical protein
MQRASRGGRLCDHHIQPDRHGRNPGEWLEQNLPKGCTYERAIRELAYDELQEGA